MHSTTHLAELIHKRCQFLRQLRELGQRQGDLIDLGDTAALLRLLGVKQQVLAKLQETERDLEPYHQEDPETRKWNGTLDRERCAAESATCHSLLREILEFERQHERKMLARRDRAAVELQQARDAAEASGAYHSHKRLVSLQPVSTSASPLAVERIPLDLTS